MEDHKLLKKLVSPITFILIGTVARLIPHIPNFVPIGAMALFGGAYLSRKQAFILPILAMVLSDLIIGFDNIPMRLTIYGSFIAMVAVGLWLKERVNLKNVIIVSLGSSILFFVTTNFAVWFFGTMYPHTISGIINCYTLALPFFRNTIAGDLFYSGIFFGGYEFLKNFSNVRRGVLV